MFLNVVMLAGLAGAAAPLVLHFLARARYTSVDWGAMMFLAGADQRQRQSLRLKQWILLAMRMAAVAMIAMAMARPVVTGMLTTLAPGGSVDAVLVIDCSASMAMVENGKSRIELARRAAVTVISQLQKGDRAGLVITGTGAGAVRRTMTGDLQGLAQAVTSFSPGDGATDVGAALLDAVEMLDAGKGVNREIYLITDRQRSNWDRVDEAFAALFSRRIVAGARPTKLMFVPVGGEDRSNLAIDSFIAHGLPAVAGQTVELELRIRNFGHESSGDVPVTISDGRKEIYRNTFLVPGDGSTVVRTTMEFDAPGCPVLTAQIRPDGLPFDDRRELAILVTKPIEVLVISGDEREGMFRKESDFLRLALSPFAASGESGADPMKVTVITPMKWQRPDPRKHPVLVLANVSSLSASQASDIEQYVYSGGSLLVAAGNLVQSENFNAMLYREGAGILPAKLGDSMSPPAISSQGLIGLDLNHPMFRFLRGRPDPVPTVAISRHMPVEMSRSDARSLMTMTSGEPLLLERPAGKGKVLLLCTTIDADWNTMPLTGFYLPAMQSMVRYLASSQLPELNLKQGEAISLSVDGIAEDAPPKVKRPDGRDDVMELRPSVLSSELRYEKTQLAGRYEMDLKIGADRRNWVFVVQPPAQESDLSSYTPDRLSPIQLALDMEELDARNEALAALVGSGRGGREMWLPLLIAALCLLALETWFARRCSA